MPAKFLAMTKLGESLLILNFKSISIGHRTLLMLNRKTFEEYDLAQFNPGQTLMSTLMGMNIIDTCSFIDEYNNVFGVKTEAEFQERVLVVKKICKPVTNHIAKWKDIEKVRNSFLAHKMRLNEGSMFFNQSLIKYNCPRNTEDIRLLNSCIQIAAYIITKNLTQNWN